MVTNPIAGMNAVLAKNWWAIAVRGILGVLFGLTALFLPGATMLSLVLVFAAYAVVDGAAGILAAVRAAQRHERWMLLVWEGIVSIAAGVLAVVWPGLTAVVFVIMVAVWALMTGGLMIGAAIRLHIAHGRWWLVLGGIVSVLYGALLIIAPLLGALVLTWWLGAYALVFGVSLIMLAFKLRSHAKA